MRRLKGNGLFAATIILASGAVATLMVTVPGSIIFVLCFLIAAMAVVNAQTKRWAYVRGWMDRSNSSFQSVAAARARGMSITEWLMSEVERDGLFYADHCLSRRDKRRLVASAKKGAPDASSDHAGPPLG